MITQHNYILSETHYMLRITRSPSSVRRLEIYTQMQPTLLIIVQRDATQISLFIIPHRVSTTPIIRSTQNCNYSLRYCAATSLQRGQAKGGSCTKNMTSTVGCSYSFVVLLMMGVVDTRNK